jgi:hypothetical protein
MVISFMRVLALWFGGGPFIGLIGLICDIGQFARHHCIQVDSRFLKSIGRVVVRNAKTRTINGLIALATT